MPEIFLSMVAEKEVAVSSFKGLELKEKKESIRHWQEPGHISEWERYKRVLKCKFLGGSSKDVFSRIQGGVGDYAQNHNNYTIQS